MNNYPQNFKWAELSSLPSTWIVVRLGEYIEEIKEKNKSNKEYPVFTISNLYGFILSNDFFNKQVYSKKLNTYKIVHRNFFAYNPYRINVGSIGLFKNKIGLVSPAYTVFKIKDMKKLYPEFLFELLKSPFYISQIKKYSMSRGSVRRSLSFKDLSDFKIPLPPFPEQKKIDRVLSKIQQAIEQQDKIIGTTKNLKKSLMQSLFTEGVINGFMFDTNIFNHILDNRIKVEDFPGDFNFFVTHIQEDELGKTPDPDRKNMLLKVFKKIDQENIYTESVVLGVSKLGYSKLSRKNNLYEKIKFDLDKKEKKKNNIHDALIAETTIKNGLILVTDDGDLLEVTQKYNGEVITLADFLYGNYRKLKETEIGVIPKSWEVVRLGDVAKTTSGGTPYRKNRRFYEGNIPWVKSGELSDNKTYNSKEKITEEGLSNSNAKILPKGTLLVAMYGATVGKTAILDIEASTNQAICAIFPKNNMFLNDYLRYYIIFSRDKLLSARYGGAQPNISQTIIRNLSFPIPPIKEQRRITYILETVDKKIEVEERRKIILEELFKTMLHKLITGEIRLKDINI